jgi:hypothetical protein
LRQYASNWSSRSGVGSKDDDLALQRQIIVTKSKEVKIGSNLAESSKEGYGSKIALLPIMMMMKMMMMMMMMMMIALAWRDRGKSRKTSLRIVVPSPRF